ncbi:MAG TPA: hypothetical protein VHB73_02640, partial [Alphaproteobacteria bacterium]|nr:hypothetical protein [Alphaproteobacteria bacterium]
MSQAEPFAQPVFSNLFELEEKNFPELYAALRKEGRARLARLAPSLKASSNPYFHAALPPALHHLCPPGFDKFMLQGLPPQVFPEHEKAALTEAAALENLLDPEKRKRVVKQIIRQSFADAALEVEHTFAKKMLPWIIMGGGLVLA